MSITQGEFQSVLYFYLLCHGFLAILFYCGSPYDVYSLAILLPHTGQQVPGVPKFWNP